MKKYVKQTKALLILLLLIWLGYIAYRTFSWESTPMGEADDYMLTTVSLQYGHNLGIDESDFQKAVQDFPEFKDYLQYCFENGQQSSVIDSETGRLPWYFGTYSAFCIPVKILFGMLGISQLKAFAVTNFLLYAVAVLMALIMGKQRFKYRYINAVLLAVNPIVFYLVWQSAEVFMFSMVALSVLFWRDKKYNWAAIFVSLAGTMNSTVMVLGIFIIVDFLCEKCLFKTGIFDYIKKYTKETFALACCFIPCLVPFIYYKVKYGCWNLQVEYGFAQESGLYGSRLLSYLFDWNYGIFPYFPVLLLFFVILVTLSFINKNRKNVFYFCAFLGVIAAYSIMYHINCGMSGIARYSAWVTPIMSVGAVSAYDSVATSEQKWRWIGDISIGVSVLYSLLLLNVYGIMFASNTSDIRLTPVAEYMIYKHPYLYWEAESSFISRVSHIPGGYTYKQPVIYYNSDRIVTKILLRSGDEDKVLDALSADVNGYAYIYKQLYKEGDYFITIPSKYKVQITPTAVLNMSNKVKDGYIQLDKLMTTGDYDADEKTIRLSGGTLQYGPYLWIPKGKYLITILGDNLETLETILTFEKGEEKIEDKKIKKEITDSYIKVYIDADKNMNDFEVININNSQENVRINSVEIEYLDD